jgi:tRNA threonylcarbamoyladenosine biosynthesis protein TsaE
MLGLFQQPARPPGVTVLSPPHPSATVLSESPEATAALGAALGERLAAGDVVALEGDLGAGKTVFVKGVAAGLGIDPGAVTSPTFTLVHEYGDVGCRCRLFHLDLYRIDHPDAVQGLGWDEAVGGRGVALVEWADRAGGWLPAERLEIRLVVAGETERRILVTARGARPRDLFRALLGAPGWDSRRLPA